MASKILTSKSMTMTHFEELKSKPIWQMTGEEFISLQQYGHANSQPEPQPEVKEDTMPKYVYGIDGIATIFGCKRGKAQQIKNSGVIDGAITQSGRKIIVDVEMALRLVRERRNRKIRK